MAKAIINSNDIAQMQGLLLSGYPQLPYSGFLFFSFEDAANTRAWIEQIRERIHYADTAPAENNRVIQLAFSYAGLQALKLNYQTLKGFSREFQEGMAGSEHRQRILGDTGNSAPEKWSWGGPENPEIHVVVLLYANSSSTLDELRQDELKLATSHHLCEVHKLDAAPLPESKEHFGFRDGISQPKIRGVSSSEDPLHLVNAGEFILGHVNERDDVTFSPIVNKIEDPDKLLPEITAESNDFGRNGSYLVFRQLGQDVHGFWSCVQSASDGNNPEVLASKMVGRWPGGAPLVEAPKSDDATLATSNSFRFHRQDVDGMRCPLGSHIRRTNPRDSLAPKPGTEDSLEINRRHRLLRRGRAYGKPLVPSMKAEDVLAREDDGSDRGLHFLCLGANISRQFEFVQSTWVNNPKFDGLYAETDPIIGSRPANADLFTCPAEPVRKRYHQLPRFVEVRGGGYFFMPSRAALAFLVKQPRELASEYSAPAAEPVIRKSTWWLALARVFNDLFQWVITATRRATRLRNLFDRLFQQRITDLLQAIIRHRRAKLKVDNDLNLGEERELPGEAEVTARITQQMTEFLFKHYRTGIAERAGNTKTYGLLKASFEVEPELPDELCVGVFKNADNFDAWVRFGGPGPLVTPDIRNNGVLSIGLKLTGVAGEKLLNDEADTHDFTAISAPTFTTPNVIENLKLQQYIGKGLQVFYFLNPFESHYMDAMLQGLYAKAHGSPFETPYWSCVPYLFGEGRAMKYRFVPKRTKKTSVPFPAPDNYLREAMIANLADGEICFDFELQMQLDPVRHPLEDASVIWDSPFTKVATLHIKPQQFDNPERDLMARQFTFNPWHAIAEHRPLGNQNRARQKIYYETSRVRQRINGESHIEP